MPNSSSSAPPTFIDGLKHSQPEDARPSQRREHLRFDKVFTVRVESMLFGDVMCVARNVSAGGIFLELADPLPLGATVRVCFPVPDGSGEVVAVGEVKNHYFINYVQNGESKRRGRHGRAFHHLRER